MDLVDLPVTDVRRRGLSLPPGVGRRGVYQLTFRDGHRYAGRTDDIILRMGGHFRTYDDIASITFGAVSDADLDDALSKLERLLGGSSPRRSHAAANDEIETITDPYISRVRWVETHLADSELSTRPLEAPGQRLRTRPKFDHLAAHLEFPLIREAIHRYIQAVIPVPAATERRNWVITSMPSTARTRVWHRLLCLSVNNVEALTIGEQFDGARWTVLGFMSAAPMSLSHRAALPALAREEGAFVAPAHYATVGDVSQIGFDSLSALHPLLDSDVVLDHVGSLVMRLVERGRGMYGRFHDYNLADAVLDAKTPLRELIP